MVFVFILTFALHSVGYPWPMAVQKDQIGDSRNKQLMHFKLHAVMSMT